MDINEKNVSTHLPETANIAEENSIRTLLQNLNETWGDADEYAALFTENADYVAFDGSHAYGRVEIAETHRPLFKGILKGSRLVEVGIPTKIRFLAPSIALVHTGGAVLKSHEKKPSRRAISVQTLVVVKHEGEWLFAAFQNTRYRPFAQTFLGKILARMQRANN